MVEGTIYQTVSGQPGELIQAPVVFRPGFDFGGWYLDANLTIPYLGKEIPATDLTVYALWIVDSTDYRAQLVEYLTNRYNWDPKDTSTKWKPLSNSYEIDEMIGMYQLAFGTDVDQAILFYAQTIDQAMDSLLNVQSMADVWAIWTLLIQAGIDEQMIENGLMNFALEMMDRQLDNYDPTYYANMIQEYQAQILILQGMLATVEGNAEAYCALLPDGVDNDCDGFFRANIDLFLADRAYLDLLNQYNNDWESGFDSYLWYMLEQILSSWYFSQKQQGYYDQYVDMLSKIDPWTRPLYENVALAYMAMMDVQFERLFPARDALSGVQDADFNYVLDIAKGFYFEWAEIYYSIQNHEWMMQEAPEWAAREALYFEKMTWVYNYATSPEGSLRIRTAIASLYGVVDYVMATFDLIYQLANSMIVPDMTPEGIHGYLQHLLAMMTMMEASMDEADIANMKLLAKDFIAFMITFEVDLPEEDKAALILAAQNAVDIYVARVLDAYQTIESMLGTMTPDQFGQIMNLLMTIMNQGGGGSIGPVRGMIEEPRQNPFAQLDLILQVLRLIDDIASPQKEGLARIVTYVIAAKYDFMYMFSYDELEAQAMMDSAYASVLRVFELVAILRDIDLDRVTPQQAQAADELMQQIDYLGMFLTLPPWMFQLKTEFGYRQENFDMILQIIHRDFAYRNTLLESARDMYVGTFQMSEEDTYYMMLSMLPRLMSVQGVRSFEDIRFWYSTLDDYGFTNAQIASFMVRYMRLRSAYEIERTQILMAEQAAHYLEMVASYQRDYDRLLEEMAQADNKVDMFADDHDEDIAAMIRAYYNALKEEQARNEAYNQFINEYVYNNYYYVFDWYLYNQLTYAMQQIQDNTWQIAMNNAALNAQEALLINYCAQFDETVAAACLNYIDVYYDSMGLIDDYYDLINLYMEYGYVTSDLMNPMLYNLYDWFRTGNQEYYDLYLAQLAAIDEWMRSPYTEVTQAYIAIETILTPAAAPLIGLYDSEWQYIVNRIQDMVRMYQHYEQTLTELNGNLTFAHFLYDDIWSNLSPEQQSIYLPAINQYAYLIEITYKVIHPLQGQFQSMYLYYEQSFVNQVYYGLYQQAYNESRYVWNDLQWYSEQLENMDGPDSGPAPLFVALLSDPLNEALAVDLVESLLNRIDTLMLEADPQFMNFLLALAMNQIDPISILTSPQAIEELADGLSDVLAILLENVSESDLAKVKTLLGKALWIQFESMGLPQEQLEALYQLYAAAFDKYVYDAFDLVDMAILAIDAITADKVTAVMIQIGVMNELDQAEWLAWVNYDDGLMSYEDYENELLEINLARAIAIANLVTTVLGDGTIDTDAILEFALNLYFDISYEFNYTGPIVIADKVLEIQLLIDQIVLQAAVIDGYDGADLTVEQMDEIETFHMLIEEIMMLLNNGPEYEEIPF